MKWVLTGSEEFGNDSKALGREAGVMKQNEKAEKRMQGKKRKGKRSNFYKRPDKRFTEKRRALSDLKTDTKIDIEHILLGPLTTMKKRPRIVTWNVRMLNVRNK